MNETVLIDALFADLADELNSEPTFKDNVLRAKIKSVVAEVKGLRKYPRTFTEEQVASDLSNYYSNMRNIALYDYNMVGAEWESNHNENGISRSFVDRKTLFCGIMPIVKF